MNRPGFPMFLLVLTALGCADLTAPASQTKTSRSEPEAPTAANPTASAPAPAPTPPPTAPPQDQNAIRASHILVAYQGAARARPDITRSKDEARKRAEQIVARAKKGEDFAKLAGELSDEPGAATRGGDLGRFTKERVVKPFGDAAFALKPGEVSGVVETNFGYHVIKRTE